MKSRRFIDQRGSMLIIVMGIVLLLSVVAISVMDLSMNTYRLSMRNEMRAQARAVAESELEYMLYQFKAVVVSQAAATAAVAPAALSSICDNTTIPTTVRSPFLAAHTDAGWTVKRSMVLENAPFTGTIPKTTKVGTFTYVTARVEVIPPASSTFANIQHVKVGRRFINSNTTLFQFSIFFQGDLELNPGSSIVVKGDVVANGSVYLGPAASSGATLQLKGKVRYLASGKFNEAADGSVAYANPLAPAVVGVTLGPPVDASGLPMDVHSSQVESMDTPENLLGGIDAASEAKNRPDLFGPPHRTDPTQWTDDEIAEAENNVYRSLILPPPSASTTTEYPNATSTTEDDNVITVRRAYSRADLVVTVETNGTVSVTKIVDGVTTDVTSQFGPAITAPASVYDEREGKTVSVTKIDVGVLKTELDAARDPTIMPATKYFDFQGLMYINVKGSSSTAPGGVKLTNATSIPFNPATGTGFSVATNGGLYLQGNYNTSGLTDSSGHAVNDSDGNQRAVPSMLLADALTVVSSGKADSTTSLPLTSRVATDAVLTVNAGLLTGNRASNTSGSSGGAQNLVRYVENWNGKTINYNGSVGRLFDSTTYVAPYAGAVGTVYMPPTRNFTFDSNIPLHPPPGNPTTTAFGRGDFFTWQ